MSGAKPFAIAKQEVWRAYLQVKSKGGAAGVDAESIGAFEQDLKGNLYRLWNRMTSGTYFPPPVREVVIPRTVETYGSVRPSEVTTRMHVSDVPRSTRVIQEGEIFHVADIVTDPGSPPPSNGMLSP